MGTVLFSTTMEKGTYYQKKCVPNSMNVEKRTVPNLFKFSLFSILYPPYFPVIDFIYIPACSSSNLYCLIILSDTSIVFAKLTMLCTFPSFNIYINFNILETLLTGISSLFYFLSIQAFIFLLHFNKTSDLLSMPK